MTKRLLLLIFGIAIVLTGCSDISSKSISEKLSTEELSNAIKSDTSFTGFYQALRKNVDGMDDIKLAKFSDITYRKLFSYYKFIRDTAYWKPLSKQWEREWKKEFGHYLPKAESTLNYWKRYLKENSLDRYVKIELAQIDKEYYDYIGELKEVNLGFRLTPIKGTIEQICFNYGFIAKINDDNLFYDRQNCISTSPFSSPTIRYWEVPGSKQDDFAGKNIETFLRDYDVYIEITSIRKDGINISVEDFDVPKEVSDCLENEKDFPMLFELSKDNLIKSLINKNYIGKREYIRKKSDKVREEEDKRCFDFLKAL